MLPFVLKKRAGLGAMTRLLHGELGVMGSKQKINLSTCKGKAAYTWPSLDTAMVGASYIGMPYYPSYLKIVPGAEHPITELNYNLDMLCPILAPLREEHLLKILHG